MENIKVWRLTVYIIAIVTLILSIGWLSTQPDYEPMITLLTAVTTIGGLLVQNDASDFTRLQEWAKKQIILAVTGVFAIGLALGLVGGYNFNTFIASTVAERTNWEG